MLRRRQIFPQKQRSLPQNMQVAFSKVLIENWVNVRRESAVRVGHEMPDETKALTAAKARK